MTKIMQKTKKLHATVFLLYFKIHYNSNFYKFLKTCTYFGKKLK